jgi:hypothetical protein
MNQHFKLYQLFRSHKDGHGCETCRLATQNSIVGLFKKALLIVLVVYHRMIHDKIVVIVKKDKDSYQL